VQRLREIAEDNVKQFAADMGEPYSDANAMYWGTMAARQSPTGARSTAAHLNCTRCIRPPTARHGYIATSGQRARHL
jgi:hypothetical protein